MDRRIDELTAQRIRTAQAAKWRVNKVALARELMQFGVGPVTAVRVLATRDHRQSDNSADHY